MPTTLFCAAATTSAIWSEKAESVVTAVPAGSCACTVLSGVACGVGSGVASGVAVGCCVVTSLPSTACSCLSTP